ncbi:MAG: septum formation protein Maf [Chlamydiae bacterium]|nr:septum formation protein Maf [Chlamydiota bacterium]MBI3276155.1 septum formation protein Maf [Chlamydiota bacterium]
MNDYFYRYRPSSIYLASQSPRRREILEKMKIPFQVVSSSYHEKIFKGIEPEELVLRHALGKARKAEVPKSAQWILGADTMVFCRGKALGKPRHLKEALKMMKALSGQRHEVWTGVVLWDRISDRLLTGCAQTYVWIKNLTEARILYYFNCVNPLDKAGAYAIQEGPKIVERINGSYSNVVGLPKELLNKMLRSISLLKNKN